MARKDTPPTPGESHADFMDRCVQSYVADGETEAEAQAECQMMWDANRSAGVTRTKGMIERAYATIQTKSIVEETRTIEGIASTPNPDRVGDIVRPKGAKFKLPMPLLWQHQHHAPVGEVLFAEADDKGIRFRAQFKNIPEAGRLKDRLDEAWQSVKHGLVKAVSIGFRILEYEPLDQKNPFGGWDIKEWDWLELSAVTIPANADCNITTIRSIVAKELAASSHSKTSAGVTAAKSTKVVKAKEPKLMAKKTVAEQISAFEATRQAKAARMEEIMLAAGEAGETLDAAQTEEYDGLQTDVKAIDDHLTRLRALEKLNIEKAAPVSGATQDEASRSRAGNGGGPTRVQVIGDNLPPGMRYIRAVMATWAARLDDSRPNPADIAKARWPDHPEIAEFIRQKTAVAAGTTSSSTWAAPLVVAANLPGEFAEYLRPMTIIGRIPGLRRVPFNISVPRQTAGASVNWVGETKVKPLSSLAFDQVTLGFTKIAGIVPLSNELIRFSSPSAEAIVRTDLAGAVVQLMDRDFVDPSKALATGVSPASITNGVTPVTATGTNAAAMRTDMATLMKEFLDNNMSLTNAVWIMTGTQALSIGMMVNALGQPEFQGITPSGGTLFGLPVITSENIPDVGDSPTNGSRIILAKADEIMLADDGNVDIAVSQEASLQMDSTPDSPATASTVLVSLWQHNMTAIRAERFINWAKRRTTAVGYINYAKYAA